MTRYEAALFTHIAGVLLFSSGIAVAGTAFESARRREDPVTIAAILGLARTGALAAVAGGAIVLAGGLWLQHLGDWGWDQAWLNWAIGLFAVAMLLGALGGRRPKRARLLAEQLASGGAGMTSELRAMLDDRVARTINYASAALVVAILGLMVFKP